MDVVGVNPERLALDWASAAEGPLYVKLITNFTRKIKGLGPLGEAEGIPQEELKAKLLAARSAVENMKLRAKFARLGKELRKENAFAPEVIQAKMAEKIDEAIIAEIAKQEKSTAAI